MDAHTPTDDGVPLGIPGGDSSFWTYCEDWQEAMVRQHLAAGGWIELTFDGDLILYPKPPHLDSNVRLVQ